jgi:hypothetical protein
MGTRGPVHQYRDKVGSGPLTIYEGTVPGVGKWSEDSALRNSERLFKPKDDRQRRGVCLERRGTGGRLGVGNLDNKLTALGRKGTCLERLLFNSLRSNFEEKGSVSKYGDNPNSYHYCLDIKTIREDLGSKHYAPRKSDDNQRTDGNMERRMVCLERRGTGGRLRDKDPSGLMPLGRKGTRLERLSFYYPIRTDERELINTKYGDNVDSDNFSINKLQKQHSSKGK